MFTKENKKNAYLYCKFRDVQYDLYSEYAHKHGMLMRTLLVWNVLYYSPEGITQTEIGQRTFNSKQTIYLIIKKMLENDDITLTEVPEDKRNKVVCLTEKGREYAKTFIPHITWAEDTAMSMFTPEEQEQLVALSRRFTDNLIELMNREGEEN